MRFVRTSVWVGIFCLGILLCAGAKPAAAATLTVCASGCRFTDFQAALDAAQPGDTILLRAGETFVGHFRLPVKSNPSGAHILITSDAAASSLPPNGTRLVPFGYSGGNTDVSALPRLVGRGATWRTTPVVEAAPGASHYILRFLNIDGLAQQGWETLVEIGSNSWSQSSLDAIPSDIVLDRLFIHGHPSKGQKRCVSVNGRNLEVRNSYIVNCMNFSYDSQAVASFNGPGPLKIVNNYLEASGENILIGGADPKIYGLVPADIEIRGNHFIKPLAWRSPILDTPGRPGASPTSGGVLGSGMHYFKIVAVIEVADDIGLSLPSAEQAVWVDGDGSAVRLNWEGVARADRYRIYMGTSPGDQNRYMETSTDETTFLYTGWGEVWTAPPASATIWNVKNLLELKNAERVVIDGNVFEHLWPASQKGYAIMFTPRNEEGGAPWSVVRDVTFSNNILCHMSGGIVILGEDDIRPSQRTGRITIRNNLIYDMSYAWGGLPHFLVITRSPYDVKVDHNSIFHEGMVVLADDGAVSGFEFTNNVLPFNEYGIFGSGAGTGNSALAAYFPDSVVRRNAFGGGPASQYPSDNVFPDVATFWAQFADPGAADFRLVSGSSFRGAGTDGRDLGVDFAALAAAAGAVSGSWGSTSSGGGSTGGGSGVGGSTGGSGGSSAPSAFNRSAAAIPGIVEAENFDNGGDGVAYGDSTGDNAGGEYRNTAVDIEYSPDGGGGYNIGWITAGEWLRYTVDVTTAGTYAIEFRVASSGPGGSFHLEVNGVDVTGSLTIPDTYGWQNWTTLRAEGIHFAAGQQVWTLVFESNGPGGSTGNVNRFSVAPGSGSSSGGTTARDVVLYAADVTASSGNWARVGSWSGAGGEKMQSQDWGAQFLEPLADPADYFEVQFVPEANRAYRLWVRLRAANDSTNNDSLWVQFSEAVASDGSPLWRIGSSEGLLIDLENCWGCGVAHWGWNNHGWWREDDAVVRFPTSAPQRLRIQIREDGVEVDQIVLSPVTYFGRAPGNLAYDTTIVSK